VCYTLCNAVYNVAVPPAVKPAAPKAKVSTLAKGLTVSVASSGGVSVSPRHAERMSCKLILGLHHSVHICFTFILTGVQSAEFIRAYNSKPTKLAL
jgi:hypothetical protein